MLVKTGESHTFDTIHSIVQVSITCIPIRYGCKTCNSVPPVDHCIVDYAINESSIYY